MVYGVGAFLAAFALTWVFGRGLRRDLTGLLTGLAICTITWSGVDPTSFPISDVLLGLALIAAVPGLMTGKWRSHLPLPVLLAAIAVFVATVLNGLVQVPQTYSDGRYLTFGTAAFDPFGRQLLNAQNGLKLIIAILVVPLLIGAVGSTRKRLMQLADLWAISAVAAALVAITDFVGVTHVAFGLGQAFGAPGQRVSGLSNHPVHLATVAVMAMPVVMTWLAVAGIRRWVGIGSLGVLALGTFCSGSRAGFVAAAVVLLAGALVLAPVRRFVLLVGLPVGLFGVALAGIKFDLVLAVLEKARLVGGGGSGSDQVRAQVAKQALRDIQERPLLGIGFDVAGDGHSVYLQAIAAGGVITLLALIAYTASTLRTVRLRTDGTWDHLTLACLVSVVAWLLVAIFENALVERYMYLPLAFLLAVAKLRAEEPPEPKQWARPGVLVSAR